MKNTEAIFIHGLGCDASDFDPNRIDDIPVNAFEYSDFTDNRLPKTVTDIAEMAEAFLNEREIQEVILIGHSLGGMVSTILAEAIGKRCRGLINIDGNLNRDSAVFTMKAARATFETFQTQLRPGLVDTLRAQGSAGSLKFADHLASGDRDQAVYQLCPSHVEHCSMGQHAERLAGLKMPRYYFHPGSSPNISSLPILIDRNVQVTEVPESGHFPMIDNPDFFYAELNRILAQVSQAT